MSSLWAVAAVRPFVLLALHSPICLLLGISFRFYPPGAASAPVHGEVLHSCCSKPCTKTAPPDLVLCALTRPLTFHFSIWARLGTCCPVFFLDRGWYPCIWTTFSPPVISSSIYVGCDGPWSVQHSGCWVQYEHSCRGKSGICAGISFWWPGQSQLVPHSKAPLSRLWGALRISPCGSAEHDEQRLWLSSVVWFSDNG